MKNLTASTKETISTILGIITISIIPIAIVILTITTKL